MEKRILKIKRARIVFKDLEEVFGYGVETFGTKAALAFLDELDKLIDDLSIHYLLHPECRHLPTKDKVYRNIIFGAYVIKYRITEKTIEVLRVFHTSVSPRKIRAVRKSKKI